MASPTLSPDSSSQEALSAPTCSPTSDSENLSPDELELLAKLEEQNRLLEADSKSMRSMNGSRRNSGSSLVSSSSASSNLSHLEEDTWILWGRIANEWEEWRRRKEKLLKLLLHLPPLPVSPPRAAQSPGVPQPPPETVPRVVKGRREQLPDLNTHFRSQSFHTSMYASSWFLTLFLTTFPLPVATRVFDIFMYEGLEIVFRVGLALLQVNQTELMQLDMEGMSQYFQRVIPHQFDSCPDKLILKAYQVKYNPKKMKRLEKEYAAMKSKEMEEQIEIKRLRTENRLLKQRIETLEKESAALADRLIQGQVTRAQEAEENYVIKRELAVVRQQCSSAAEDLQKARSTIRQLQEQQDNPRLTEDFVAHLETELEQSRLRETETLGALREMQDKVLDMEKRNSSLPDENNVARLQEELKALKVREGEAVASARELKLQLQELSDTWQAHLSRGGRWKESPRKLVLGELQDELMSVRLREAQALAEGRELRQRVVELETQGQGSLTQEDPVPSSPGAGGVLGAAADLPSASEPPRKEAHLRGAREAFSRSYNPLAHSLQHRQAQPLSPPRGRPPRRLRRRTGCSVPAFIANSGSAW
ncbi:EVI5-like protein [Puma concolor]|uniref:EVI5-like protein n=1 Tax=Puma concolor TaxID=9696 RepID=A0A6P6H926_PUMCO|nr:EVI5-like protein [Puma concolor]